MGKAFDFKIGGLDKLQGKLKKLPPELIQNIDGALKSEIAQINEEQVRRTPIDRAEIRNSTGFIKEKGNKATIEYALFSNAPHSVFMEFGTKKHFQPIAGVDTPDYQPGKQSAKGLYESILAWVKRKGIAARFSVKTQKKLNSKADQKREEEAAYLIYRSILINGVRPQPFFYAPFLASKDKIVKAVAQQIKHL